MNKVLFCVLCLMSFSAIAAREEILGFSADEKGVSFQVRSGGCTSKADFGFVVLDTHPAGLILNRQQPDPCEAVVPFGTTVTFSYEELGFVNGDKFNILNPIATITVTTSTEEALK